MQSTTRPNPEHRPTATGSPRPTPRPTHRPYIQGLRAIAVLAVMATHAALPIPGGFTGVDMFFVISGFVITLGLCRQLDRTGTINLRTFYSRRIRRLLPALAVMVATTCLIATALISPFGIQQVTAKSALAAVFGVANLVIADLSRGYFGTSAQLNPLLHTWSLSVEEQFYVAFPLLAVALTWVNRHRPRRAITLAAACLIATSLATSWIPHLVNLAWQPTLGPYSLTGYYGPLPRLAEFAVGVLLAVWATNPTHNQTPQTPATHRQTARNTTIATLTACVGTATLITALVVITPAQAFPVPWALLPVAGTALVIAAAERHALVIPKLLATKPLTTIGDMSYSLYLWHWPFVVFSRQLTDNPWAPLAATCLSIGPAWLSYRYIEQRHHTPHARTNQSTNPPQQTNTPTTTSRTPQPLITLLAASTGAVTLTAAALGVGAKMSWGSPDIAADYRSISTLHPIQKQGCHTEPSVQQLNAGECTWNAGAERTIYLLGDSHANHISTAVINEAQKTGFAVIAAAGLACPIARPDSFYDPGMTAERNTGCANFMHNTVQWIAQQQPGVVILSAADTYWSNGEHRLQAGQAMRETQPALLDRYRSALGQIVGELRAAGHEVVIVQTVPNFWYRPYYFAASSCATVLTFQQSCSTTMPLAHYEKTHGHIRTVRTAVAAEFEAHIVDPIPVLCPDQECSVEHNGKYLYKDTNHLTVYGASLIQPLLGDVLQRIN